MPDSVKAGIEIHQQLDTGKLFCRCSSAMAEQPAGQVTRKLRAVAGETGDIYIAAAEATSKGKVYTYKTFKGESCLVELDDEPPQMMDPTVLGAALEIALLLNCTIPDEVEVMRKTVIDGSNTSGFQRTAVVGLNGHINTSFGKVGIPSVAIEEDACMIISRSKEGDTYALNRLGIPLVEIGTAPDCKSPAQVKELAEKLGLLLRSTGKVKRGLGTIRQDVNVSIPGGDRVEIKGAQDLALIPKLVQTEASRQASTLKSGKKVAREVRKAEKDATTTYLRLLPGAARLYPETDIPPIRISKSIIGYISKNLPELLEDKISALTNTHKLDPNIAKNIAKDKRKLALFERISSLKNVKPSFAADVLLSYERTLPGYHTKVTDQDIEKAFVALDQGLIENKSVMVLLAEVSEGRGFNIDKYEITARSEDDAFNLVQKVIAANPQALALPRPESALMGLVMKENRGQFPGALLARVLKEELDKGAK